jgi:hypothetical protein
MSVLVPEDSWNCRKFFKLLERAVALAGPRVNQRQVRDPDWTVKRVLGNRQELDRAKRLADRRSSCIIRSSRRKHSESFPEFHELANRLDRQRASHTFLIGVAESCVI